MGELSDRVIAPNAVKPYFARKPCWFETDVDRSVECGFLHVLENRYKPTGRTIKLAVVIFKGGKSGQTADPVLKITGGPGGASHISPTTGAIWTELLPKYTWLGKRDLIVFDQRGVGWSQPALDCPSFRAHRVFLLDEDDLRHLMTECRDVWVESGVDLAAYSTNAIAADAEDLRRALDIPTWTLWGPSYGSRVALTMMQKYPQSISSAILESVLPTDINVDEPLPGVFVRLVDKIFRDCEQVPHCRKKYPNLMLKLAETLKRLEREQIIIPVKVLDLSDRPRVDKIDYDVGPLDYLTLLQAALRSAEDIAQFPKLIHRTWRGDYSALSDIAFSEAASSSPGFFAHGLAWSVYCTDPIIDPASNGSSHVPEDHPLAKWLKAKKNLNDLPCQHWLTDKRTSDRPEPVRADVPTLILAGIFDPVTPVEFARHVAGQLPNGHLFEFPANGHDASSNDCAAKLIAAFLEHPERRPANICTDWLKSPIFVH